MSRFETSSEDSFEEGGQLVNLSPDLSDGLVLRFREIEEQNDGWNKNGKDEEGSCKAFVDQKLTIGKRCSDCILHWKVDGEDKGTSGEFHPL